MGSEIGKEKEPIERLASYCVFSRSRLEERGPVPQRPLGYVQDWLPESASRHLSTGFSSSLFEGCPLGHYFSLKNALGQKWKDPHPSSPDAVSSSLSFLKPSTEPQLKPEGGRGNVLQTVE